MGKIHGQKYSGFNVLGKYIFFLKLLEIRTLSWLSLDNMKLS